eukprot:CAMPEP_0175088214 /NCGR_PEP_ID=MMETSP0086_2-20121207/132_1 /TAXON_ID=136419 /ORGANISM="Unknown Unknown, Strain D1" /LENGTH=600 /DNA_ID=CAMNT_0016360639 /DNA_START=267 /DNA_END=2069 /DNA_ORIENTATION=-
MSSFASFSPVSSFASSSPSSGSKRPSGKQEKEQPVRRGNKDRLVVKLSVDLLQTFNLINQSYYLQKKKRLSEQRRNPAHKKQRRHGGNVDKECNYIVKYAEVLNERYIVEKIIGKGSFGRVVRAHDKVTQEQVAIKIIKRKDPFFNQAQVEIKILQTLQEQENAHIVRYKEHFMHHNHQCIVFELLSHNLFELLRTTEFQGVSLNLVSEFSKQILKALCFLRDRSKGIIHCDLKPENILLCHLTRTSIKVIDFGSACFADQPMYAYIQSRFYRAPEVLLGLSYDCAIDMWSLGCILAELFTGKPLFDGEDEAHQIKKQVEVLGIPDAELLRRSKKASVYFDSNHLGTEWKLTDKWLHNFRPSSLRAKLCVNGKFRPSSVHYRFEHLISRMLDYNPATRITPAEAMQHVFFAQPMHVGISTDLSIPVSLVSPSLCSISPGSSDESQPMSPSILSPNMSPVMNSSVLPDQSHAGLSAAWSSSFSLSHRSDAVASAAASNVALVGLQSNQHTSVPGSSHWNTTSEHMSETTETDKLVQGQPRPKQDNLTGGSSIAGRKLVLPRNMYYYRDARDEGTQTQMQDFTSNSNSYSNSSSNVLMQDSQ